jgi:anti-sigma B factor antagonist
VLLNRESLTPFSAPLESSRSPEVNSQTKQVRFFESEGAPVINLYINERRSGDVIVLDLKGRIRISGGTTALHKSVRCLVEEGKTQILLNLSQVTHIDSSGLGELLASRVTVTNRGGDMKLSHLTERMQEILTMSKLASVFDIYNNEIDAVASFKGEVLRIAEPLPFFM